MKRFIGEDELHGVGPFASINSLCNDIQKQRQMLSERIAAFLQDDVMAKELDEAINPILVRIELLNFHLGSVCERVFEQPASKKPDA